MKGIKRSFFERPTLTVARELLGKRLVRRLDGGRQLAGLIVETEGYVGTEDLGCHARAGRTRRNRSMWGPPGHAYVYFTYGMHWMLNFVTEREGFPAAVLIRAVVAQEGLNYMLERRGPAGHRHLADGPAKLCQAFAIDSSFDGSDLCTEDSKLFVEEAGVDFNGQLRVSARIGLNNVPEPWKSIPWRFVVEQ